MLMTNKKFEHVWVRVAGHAQMIRSKTVHHWRCFINGEAPEINLRTWDVTGNVTPANMMAGSNPTGEGNGLVAWIDFYGDAHIDENDILHVMVRAPLGKPPAG